MKKKTKVIVIISSIVSAVVLTGLGGAYFTLLHRYKGKKNNYVWSKDDIFDLSKIKTVEKDPNKDFVILNLADIQICDLGDFGRNMRNMKEEIYELVDRAKPDLITLTGDQTWSNENKISLERIVRWLDDLKIPYAPVFGNHDCGNGNDNAVYSKNKCGDVYEKGKYSLFSKGPNNLGEIGNYVVNITENDKVIKSLYMLDAGTGDIITDQQKEWFKWNADGIKGANENYANSMVFMHKPLPEYWSAYLSYWYGEAESIGDVHVHSSLRGTDQNGFFDLAKSCGVKDVVVGHQHWSNFTIKYKDVRLTMALKTGEHVGYYEDENVYLNGASVFTLQDDEVSISNLYVSKEKYHLK